MNMYSLTETDCGNSLTERLIDPGKGGAILSKCIFLPRNPTVKNYSLTLSYGGLLQYYRNIPCINFNPYGGGTIGTAIMQRPGQACRCLC
jgi:hypothetical protein